MSSARDFQSECSHCYEKLYEITEESSTFDVVEYAKRFYEKRKESQLYLKYGEYAKFFYDMNNDSKVFEQYDLFPKAFPSMEEIRRQGKLCDVVLKVINFKYFHFGTFIV